MKVYSEKYPSSEGFVAQFMGQDAAAPTASVKLYEKVLSGAGKTEESA